MLPEYTHTLLPTVGRLLCWLDLETTGADEAEDHILEVGYVVTHAKPPFEELMERNLVILPPAITNWQLRLKSNEVVREMHVKNGLINDLFRHGLTRNAVSNIIRNDLAGTTPRRLRLAGSGVGHFDRRFLRAHMPTVNDLFDFPVVDVGVVRRTLREYAGREDLLPQADEKPHRALADAKLHLAEFRYYVELFRRIRLDGVDRVEIAHGSVRPDALHMSPSLAGDTSGT